MYSFIPDGLAGHDDTLKSAYGDGNGKPSTEKAKKVLADAGVYKLDEAGRAGFVRFLASMQ